MGIAFRVASSYLQYVSGTNTISVAKPTRIVDGDIILAFIVTLDPGGRPAITPPSGWTEIAVADIGTYSRLGTYWKRASSEGSSWSFTKDGDASGAEIAGYVLAYSGCLASGDPVDVYSNTTYLVSDTTVRAAGVTTTADNDMLVAIGYAPPADSTVHFTSTDLTERLDSSALRNPAGYLLSVNGDVIQSVAGASGNKDCTLSTAISLKHAFLVALMEAALVVEPTGITSATAFGTPGVHLHVAPSGISSAQALGEPALTVGPVNVSPAGIASTTAFGTPTLGDSLILPGIASTTAFGTPTVDPVLRNITPAGIAAAGAFGTPAVVPAPVAIPPADRSFIRLLDSAGVLVGILPAQVKWTLRLLGTATLDSVVIPWEYLQSDGSLDGRLLQIEQGWYCLWDGRRYIVEDPSTDNETGITFTARSAECELANFYTNYSPGPATFLNMLPSAICAELLAGRAGRTVKNAGFGILDATNLPTNWYHPTGWTSALVSNRRVWQADAGSEESYSDDLPCTPGISYRVKVDVCAANATGTRGVKLRWIAADGTTTDSAATPLATENGAFHTVDTGDLMALGTRLRIVLYTSGTAGTTQFDDVRLLEAGPDTGWMNVGTAMDARLAAIPYNDGAIQRYGVWAEAGAPANRIESTAAGDYVARVINGPFVTIHFAAGGVGARAKIRVNGVVQTASLDVSAATTYTVSGLDPANDHIVEAEVAAVKVAFAGFTVSAENLISMRWDWKTTYEAIVSVREAVGGELEFDTVAKTLTHKAAVGQNLTTNNVVDFRRGSNIVKMDRTEDRSKLINQVTGLGYGEGQYQLVATVDDTTLDDAGQTSQQVYGVQRGMYSDKECLSLATMTATLQRMVAQSAWYRNAYQVQVTSAAAELCAAGDTGHFVYDAINENLRILEITRSTESSAATFKVANIAEDLTYKLEATRKDLATLQKSYQGVPSDANDSFSEQFERTAGGTDTPATVDFFIPYGADLLDLRLRYQVGGLRAFAKAVGGGSTTASSGGGSTSGSGGSSTPTSSDAATPSGGASTSGMMGTLSLAQITGQLYTDGPRDETSPYAFNNTTGNNQSPYTDPHAHGLHGHIHGWDGAGLAQAIMSNVMDAVEDHAHSTPNHTHPNHSHTVTIGSHTHTTPDHTHPIPDHAHTLSYGIYESSTPATVRLYLDGALITALNDSQYVSDFDLLPYVTKDSNGRVAEGWHTLEWKSATAGATGRVRGTVFARKFIATEAA